ncbi:hypothetical protein NPIL_544891 [Nephila pilipes]|uniref:Uncharacterized protein n=1 Tax=Nephila pilipes TaxID=299642 RepID=A0A8X6Q7W7_NEPPI|nr:hypothetical protein NPIL_544891 [Nephila pilipes]
MNDDYGVLHKYLKHLIIQGVFQLVFMNFRRRGRLLISYETVENVEKSMREDRCTMVLFLCVGSWSFLKPDYDGKVAILEDASKMGPSSVHRRSSTATNRLFSKISSPLCRRKQATFGIECDE